jgi:acyl dehydratase
LDRGAIGRESKPAVNEVEKGSVRRFAEALGETNPLCLDESAAKAAGYKGLVAPPTYPVCLRSGSDLREGLLVTPGTHLLQADQSFEYARPIVAGDVLTVQSRVVDISQHATPNGPADVVILEDEGRDPAGELVYRSRSNWVMLAARKTPGAGEAIHE